MCYLLIIMARYSILIQIFLQNLEKPFLIASWHYWYSRLFRALLFESGKIKISCEPDETF